MGGGVLDQGVKRYGAGYLGHEGAPIETVITRGVDTSRFSQPSPYTGNGEDVEAEAEAFGGRPITSTPPN